MMRRDGRATDRTGGGTAMNRHLALTIDARPEPVSLIPERTAVVVVDLQNGTPRRAVTATLPGAISRVRRR